MNDLSEVLDELETKTTVFCDKMRSLQEKYTGEMLTEVTIDRATIDFDSVFNTYAPRIMVEHMHIVVRKHPHNYGLVVDIYDN